MRKIVLLYFLAILACVCLGMIVALAGCYSKWYLVLLIIPFSLGWLPLTIMSGSINKHLEGTTAFIFLSFLSLIVALILGAINIEEISFWGIVYMCSCFAAIIETVVIMLRIHILWMSRSL